MRTADPSVVIDEVVSSVVPADALSEPAENSPPNMRLLPVEMAAAVPTVLAPAVIKAPDVLSVRFCPTFEVVSVTWAAVSVTLAEPDVLTTRVGAAMLSAVIVPEPERKVRIVPALIALPAADSFTLPAPAAVSATAPAPESVPSTEMSPLSVVLRLAVLAATLPVIVVLPAEVVVRAVAVSVPPRFIAASAVNEATLTTMIVPVVLRSVPAVAVRLPVESVLLRLMFVPEVKVAVPAILLAPEAVRLPLAANTRSPPTLESLNTTLSFLSFIDTKPAVLAVTIGALTLFRMISPLLDCRLRRLPAFTAL